MKMLHAGLALAVTAGLSCVAMANEEQLTFAPQGHDLDNNDNFSPDGRHLVYDTRETVGPGIDNCLGVEKIALATGEVTVLYRPSPAVTGESPAPGVGAASFSPDGKTVAFIHGPPVAEVAERGPYGKTNRCGAAAAADGSGTWRFLDRRDVATDRDTLPGAHRGGTHRHEFSRDGRRIGYTYDDHLRTEYDRTVGYMEAHPNAPAGASHYCAVLVPVVPAGTAKPGELEKAWGDAWVDGAGTVRAFIGLVREDDGSLGQSLFTVTIPADTDITTADSGGPERFPAPPEGVTVRRVTRAWAEGIVRGAPDGKTIAYYGHDSEGQRQLFVVPVDGGDGAADPAKRPRQAGNIPSGAASGLRWHPDGATLFCITGGNGVVAVSVAEDRFGEMRWLLPEDDGPERSRLVVSPDGTLLAFNKAVPTFDDQGERAVNYAGEDFMQIFLLRPAE